MPKSTGTLSNCYKLTINDEFIGYFKSYDLAQVFVERIQAIKFHQMIGKIEPWFIEGEF